MSKNISIRKKKGENEKRKKKQDKGRKTMKEHERQILLYVIQKSLRKERKWKKKGRMKKK
jgi:hypothetical protein